MTLIKFCRNGNNIKGTKYLLFACIITAVAKNAMAIINIFIHIAYNA